MPLLPRPTIRTSATAAAVVDRVATAATTHEILNEYAPRPPDMDHGVPFSVFLAIYRDVTRP
jgi:hypothetical protein